MKNAFRILYDAGLEFFRSAKGFWPLWLLAAILLGLVCFLELLGV